ncbi:VirE N-terminal domain-containing protein [Mucilaginibacter lappiensis]|uniref:BT4734-like N-terminal domain-containing protein n=1 Tax=Mucilaginibacter lappiensis TaxID=354630 RepID=A0ABR6PPG9_9SPHI|nr:BT4734/BF3469 family protein [Mucilaginibacter lappiensis]MBB6111531.1 hypothetical protein [Mucilaginibacter lappiensis]SIR80929.1 VirE N-terminal domain-containing protein [Mucilaginibacter lappiensis]
MIDEKCFVISKYNNAVSKIDNNIDLFEELNMIKTGVFKDSVLLCRNLLNEGLVLEYKQAKAKLPAVTFSGRFNGSHRKENLIDYNGFIIIDLDGIETLKVKELKQKLFDDDYVWATWTSPSNRGIKILIKTNANVETHKLYFDELVKYIKLKYDLNVDKSGSDVCRLCFSSYDPDILIKESYHLFEVDVETISSNLINEINPKRQKSNTIIQPKFVNSNLDKLLFYSTDKKNSQSDRIIMGKVIKYLKKHSISITSNYEQWYKVGLSIANTFTFDIGKKYYLEVCSLDGINHDEYKSLYLLEYCYRNRKMDQVSFATIIYFAEQKGFILKNKT